MKSFILMLLFLGFVTFSYSQNKPESVSNEGNMKPIDLPEVVIKKAGKDFSIYLPDKNPDANVRKLEQEFIAYDLGKDYDGYENYLVILEMENGSLVATYNANGKLVRVVEKYKNVKLPNAVIYSVYKTYPNWEIVNDKFLYTQEDGDVINKHYSIKIKKGDEVKKLLVDPNGTIL
jgi:hypothetical protein